MGFPAAATTKQLQHKPAALTLLDYKQMVHRCYKECSTQPGTNVVLTKLTQHAAANDIHQCDVILQDNARHDAARHVSALADDGALCLPVVAVFDAHVHLLAADSWLHGEGMKHLTNSTR
jgi:hypothetical protein